MEPERFLTFSSIHSPVGQKVIRILSAALSAVDPYQAVRRVVHREDHFLRIQDKTYALKAGQKVVVIGAGKAAVPMGLAIEDVIGWDKVRGLVITKEGHLGIPEQAAGIEILEAGHPIPDQRGVEGTRQIVRLLKGLSEEDLVVCLLSGGGSALLFDPAGDLPIEAIQDLTSQLLACGADIQEINTLRKHLDRVKGGQLARLADPAQVVSLVLSDVVGDALDAIASGPTAPDPTTFQQSLAILERYGLVGSISPAIVEHLRCGASGEISETPKADDPLFTRVRNIIIGSNLQAAQAAVKKAQAEGFRATLLSTYIQGEARQAGKLFSAIARQIDRTGDPLSRPACLIAGGETTVILRGQGKGGRNQELALSAGIDLAGIPDVLLAALATDGGDGPTDAAGAMVTGETAARARDLGLDPVNFLENNDSYHFFDSLGDLIRCGPTQTNVNDLVFLFAN